MASIGALIAVCIILIIVVLIGISFLIWKYCKDVKNEHSAPKLDPPVILSGVENQSPNIKNQYPDVENQSPGVENQSFMNEEPTNPYVEGAKK